MAPGAVILPGASDEPRFRHRPAPGQPGSQGELLQRPLRLQDDAATGRPTSASSTTRARTTSRRASRAGGCTSRPTRRTRCSTCRGCSAAARSTSSRSATTRRRAPSAAVAPGRLRRHSDLNLSGIGGQQRHRRPVGAASGLAIPGGLVRVNSAGNGRGAPYDPYSLTFADSLSRLAGNHFMKFGGDVRLIRMTTDQLGGTTYTLRNLTAFLANTPTTIQYLRRSERAEPVQQRRDGRRSTSSRSTTSPSPRTNGGCGPTSR